MTNKKEQAQDFGTGSEINQPQNKKLNRRTILKAMAGVPVLGVFAYEAMKNLSYAQDKKTRVIKELGLENIQAPKIISNQSGLKGDRLRVGFIGFGSRANQLVNGLGFMHPSTAESQKRRGRLDDWMAQEDMNVALTGICDVFDLHAERGLEIAREGLRVNGKTEANYPVKRFRTYREMLEDKDIDAVIIASPEHLHAQMTIDAVQAGKHVYCEKSFTRTEQELYDAYDAVKSSNSVFQLGHLLLERQPGYS